MASIDYKKLFPQYYRPKKTPSVVDIPEMQYLMVDGKGDPNKEQSYADAIEALYAVAYALKMKIIKKEQPENNFVVMPLEGLWYKDDMSDWSMDNKDEWEWTMMIRMPDFVTEQEINRAITIVRENKNPVSLDKLRFEKYNEGKSVQVMYIGAYADEGPTIANLHQFAEDQGYELSGKHHEIYLGDPRKTAPEKLKTIIRQPIS